MMEAKPFIKQGWARALFFVVCFTALTILALATANWLIGNSSVVKQEEGVSKSLQNNMQGKYLLLYISISVLISVLTVYCFRKLVDKQSLTSLGLALKNNLSHAAVGLFLGFFLLGAGSLILVINNNLQWTDIVFDAGQLFIGFGSMFLVAFSEELVFRGYILNNLMLSTNKWIALVISALLFALIHINNPGITPVAIINVFIAGMLLGINYIYTKNLWFGILFHFSWNFYQGSVLGYKVSGVNLQGLLEQQLYGNSLLTGGPFGFEGSVIDGVLSIIAILLLAWVYEKRYEV
ncbi:MAG: CPBP family intramembrane glutamic endopeptidase [Chitinophagaceae bacterium]